jgi:uncharacterized membrane protein
MKANYARPNSAFYPSRNEEKRMNARLTAVLLASSMIFTATNANAIGCFSGGAAGAVAGHYAGHHAVLGAVGGCVVGHHLAKKKKAEQRAAAQAQQHAYGHS